MAISGFEIKKHEKAMDKYLEVHRPPAHLRNGLDTGYRIENQSIEIFELTPSFRDPS